MRKALVGLAVLLSSSLGFSQMMGGMMGGMMGNQPGNMMPQQVYIPSMGCMGCGMMRMMGMMGGMMPMMGMGGMGMMPMMKDPETMMIIREHYMKCQKELMEKLSKKKSGYMTQMMLMMLAQNPQALKEALKNNPELKKKLKEALE